MIFNEIENGKQFLLENGDSLCVLKTFPSNSIDCIITSPPYWQQRIYSDYDKKLDNILGCEDSADAYVENLMKIIRELYRVLKPTGTFWLNLGDKFFNKCLMGIPWRVALAMQNEGWVLRSDIIWDQMKGTQSCTDRFRDIYEHIFQFVKTNKTYYFNAEPVKIIPEKDPVEINGKMTSATGVSGKKYYEQIKTSKYLSEEERINAKKALDDTIQEMKDGIIVDFRMTIRGAQRAYHSENVKVSGRAKELQTKGFYIIKMRKSGFLPSDIWRIVPEDKWRKDGHCAVFPEELLRTPILSTCPENGIVLDPFSGTGSTVAAAVKLNRRGIGIDLSSEYTNIALKRLQSISGYLNFGDTSSTIISA